MILALLWGCTQPPGEIIAERWNVVFRVDAMAEDEGCEVATTSVEPALPFVGIGYGRGAPDTVSIYWCESAEVCEAIPWATVWIDEATEKDMSGQRGLVSVTGGKLCLIDWAGAQGHIGPGDEITLDVQLYSGTPFDVEDASECDAFLQAVAGSTCDITRSFEGTIVP